MTYSIVIPVYKSADSLAQICDQVNEVLIKLNGLEMDIIFVNDSPFYKPTCDALNELEGLWPFVRVINLRKNNGQHIAQLVGMSHSQSDYVITMDDDLQHPVPEILKLISGINNDDSVDVIMAIPEKKGKKHSTWRNLGSTLLNKMDVYFLDKPKELKKSPFRIIRKTVVDYVVKNHNATPSVNSLLIKTTNRIKNIEFKHESRGFGKSGYTFKKMVTLFINNLIHYSSLPLKFVGFIGVMAMLFSALFIVYILTKKIFFGIDFKGYSSIVILISFFGGFNLLGLGIIGEYLIRIMKEQQKPELQDLIQK